MWTPQREHEWVTLRAAFGRRGPAKALALQVRASTESPTQFRIVSNLVPDRTWRVEGVFARSDECLRIYRKRLCEAKLVDYFDQRPKQTPPRWLVPAAEGLLLAAPADPTPREHVVPEPQRPARPSILQWFVRTCRRSQDTAPPADPTEHEQAVSR